MTSILLSKRAAELLGPPPDNPINWEDLINHKPRVLVSKVPFHQHVLVERKAHPHIETEQLLTSVVDVYDDDDEWQVNAKKRPRIQTNTRRVSLESTPILERNEESSPVSRRKLRRLEKQRKHNNLKQSTIMESFRLRRST